MTTDRPLTRRALIGAIAIGGTGLVLGSIGLQDSRTPHQGGRNSSDSAPTPPSQSSRQLHWARRRSRNSTVSCPGGTAVWRWVILGEGYSLDDRRATLTVTFLDGSTRSTEAIARGDENGSRWFEVTRPDGGTVVDAVVSSSNVSSDITLTLVASGCREGPGADPPVEDHRHWQIGAGEGSVAPNPP